MALQQRQAQPYTPNRFFDPDEDFQPASAGAPPAGTQPQPATDTASLQAQPANTSTTSPTTSPAQDQFFSAQPQSKIPTFDDYTAQHGNAPVAGAPVVPHHGKIASIMLGIGEAIGNPLATRIGERDRQLQLDANDYQRKLPASQYAANRAAYEQEIGNENTASTINKNNSEAQRVPWEMEKDLETRKANAISQILEEKESGKFADDVLLSRWQRIARANPRLGITDKDINDAIAGTKAPAPVFKSSNGTIEPLTYQGKSYGLEPTENEPGEVTSARTNALHSLQVEQLAKLNPIVRGQLGEPPSDPHQLATYMKKAEEITTRMSAAPRIEMQNQRAVQVGDPNTGAVTYEHAGEAIKNKDQAPGSIGFSAQKTAANAVAKGEVPKNIGDQKVAFNTAISHAQLLEQAADALKNGDQQTLNSLTNRFKNEFGSAGPVNAQAIANAYSREVTKMLSGGHITDAEIGATGKTLDPNVQGPEQIKGVLSTYKALAQSKLKNLTDQESAALHRGTGDGASQPPPGATHAVKDANGNILGYTSDGKTMIPAGKK